MPLHHFIFSLRHFSIIGLFVFLAHCGGQLEFADDTTAAIPDSPAAPAAPIPSDLASPLARSKQHTMLTMTFGNELETATSEQHQLLNAQFTLGHGATNPTSATMIGTPELPSSLIVLEPR